MDTLEKLKTLAEDSQYDLACACGTGKYDRRSRGTDGKWIYPVSLPQGGYSILLKTLFSNFCANDCKYCPLRSNSNIKRCSLKEEEIARVFMDYFKKREVFGLFLSSGVIGDPDYTMGKINSVAGMLRYKYGFRGYIHLKIIPGASDAAIEDTLSLASAVSLNIETAGEKHFKLLSNKKNYMEDIIRPIKLLSKLTSPGERYSGVKSSTQFIVGASDETDSEIVNYMFGLYKRLNFDRVYFSTYQQGLGDPGIPGENFHIPGSENPFMREHRLYQADFLIRKYGFEKSDIIFDESGNLRIDRDPKEVWADNHPEFYPVRLNSSDKESLLRVPGLGLISVNRILKMRKLHRIVRLEDLNVSGKRLEKVRNYISWD